MSLETYEVPDKYQSFRLLTCGYWDASPDEKQDEVFIAAPNRAAAEQFVRRHDLHRLLDESYSKLPDAHVLVAHVIVDNRGEAVEPIDVSSVISAMQQSAAGYIVVDTEGRQVINPGNAEGKTWQFVYRHRFTQQPVYLIVEATSAEDVLNQVASSPAEYGIAINPLDEDAHKFGIYLKPGAKLPETSFTVEVGSWLRLDGSLTPDPERAMTLHEPYVSAAGMFWPSAVHDGDWFWRIDGQEGKAEPYPVQYRLPSGAVVSPKVYANASECFACGDDAPAQLQWEGAPDVVFCSKRCIEYANSEFALLLSFEPGNKKKRPFRNRIFGPVRGLPAVLKLKEQLLSLASYRNKDADVVEEIRLRPLTELPKR